MKKVIAATILALTLLAQGRQISPVPLPRTTLVDLDPTPYDRAMLQEALDAGEIFTFLAKSSRTEDPDLVEQRRAYAMLFRLGGNGNGASYRVAFLVPAKKIGKYAASTTESALAYLAQRNRPFEMEVFTVPDEENATLEGTLVNLSGFNLVIAPVTAQGAAYLCSRDLPGRFFIPTLNRKTLECDNGMVSFGGIDYDRQIETLSYLVEPNGTAYAVSDRSRLSRNLTETVRRYVDLNGTIVIGKNGYYKDVIERYDDLNDSTIFLNVPVVRSSLFLSQMTLADFKPRRLLSTQLNYSPLLLTLTQYHDRENLVVASSIGEMDPYLSENIALVGQDIRFNWINYATVTGLDDDFAAATGDRRLGSDTFVDGNIDYTVRLYDAGLYRFIPREVPRPEEEIIGPYEEEPLPDDGAVDEPSVFSQEESSE